MSELYPTPPNFQKQVKEVVLKFKEQASLYDKLSTFLNIPFDREKAEWEFNNLYQIKQNLKHQSANKTQSNCDKKSLIST